MSSKRKPVILLEVDYWFDKKISRLRRVYDDDQVRQLAAVQVFTIILCELRLNGTLPLNSISDFCYERRLPEALVLEVIKYCQADDINLLKNNGVEIYSEGLNNRLERYDHLCQLRRTAGRKGGLAKSQKNQSNQIDTSTCLPSDKHLVSKDIYISNNDLNTNEDLSNNKRRKRAPLKQEFKRYGQYLQMAPANMKKLVDKFGRDQVIKQIPDANHWIATDLSANASKYRDPRQDHYLFFSGWLRRNSGQQSASMTGGRSQNEAPRPQPPIYVPPKVEDPASPEAVAAFRKGISELAGKKVV